jgi:cobalt/nickel transport system permease protein
VHLPDGWIDVPTSAGAYVVAAGATAVSAQRAGEAFRGRVTTLPAVIAAYVLVAQLLVLPVGLGTSAHLIGTGLAALLVGPDVAIVCVSAVVVVQALLLADGGVTAIGLNVINDGVVPALVAWAVWRLLRDRLRSAATAGGIAAGVATFVAGCAVALEFVLGGTNAVPAGTVAASIGGAHLLIAVAEGVLTGAVLRVLLRRRPDLVRAVRDRHAPQPTPTPRASR